MYYLHRYNHVRTNRAVLKANRSIWGSLLYIALGQLGKYNHIDNPGRSLQTATYRVECPTRKAGYIWSNVHDTRASPDDLKFSFLAFFPLYRKDGSDV